MSESSTPRQIVAAGDWHGDTRWGIQAVSRVATRIPECRRIYHLGDFGIWHGPAGANYLDTLNTYLDASDIELWVTPGNHENWDMIQAHEVGRDGLAWFRPRIGVIPRGHRWSDQGRSFVSLGGAPSVDLKAGHRVQGESWWVEEMITPEEAQAVADAGYADVMLAHDSPDGGVPAVQRIIDDPFGVQMWGKAGIAWAKIGRVRMNTAYYGVMPRLFAHGHFHEPGWTDDGEHAFLSLGMNRQAMNLARVDLDTWEVDWGW